MQTITVKCRVLVDDPNVPLKTFAAYADACTELNRIACEHETSNSIRLHHLAYRSIRQQFGLSANLTCTAIRRVCGNIKATGFKPRQYRATSVSYDARIFSFREQDWTISITTLEGRRRFSLVIGDYQRNLLKGRKPKFCTLIHTRKGFAINISIEIETIASLNKKVLGVDCGIKRLAVASTGKIWSSEKLLLRRDRFSRVRASLQSKGTKGAKHVLKRLSGRESRFVRWINHNVSKELVALARRKLCGKIAFEDLRHIRSRAKRWNRHANRMLHAWSFGELQGFTRYKAALAGIETVLIDPQGTSKTCNRCGEQAKRNGQALVCTTCGKFDADVNAAKNIAERGAACKPARELTVACAMHTAPVKSPRL